MGLRASQYTSGSVSQACYQYVCAKFNIFTTCLVCWSKRLQHGQGNRLKHVQNSLWMGQSGAVAIRSDSCKLSRMQFCCAWTETRM